MNTTVYAAKQALPVVEKSTNEKELRDLAKNTAEALFSCQTVFPFTFFPDRITVDQNKVDIIYSYFLFTKTIVTLMIEDIRTVEVNTGPLFAEMRFEINGYGKNPPPIRYLAKEDAIKMRRMIMGLAVVKRKEVETEGVANSQIKKNVEKIGLVPD